MKDSGHMDIEKVTGDACLQKLVIFMKANTSKISVKARESIIGKMDDNTLEIIKTMSALGMENSFTPMVTCMSDPFSVDQDQALEYSPFPIKLVSIVVNGRIQLTKEPELYAG
mmetsp:Transcript_16257/g.30164  ORF Transcript_16257/g.30164 Transcript_16257/m.30164 type:complete len:113 (+) Transcript_16257:765-1103(+)